MWVYLESAGINGHSFGICRFVDTHNLFVALRCVVWFGPACFCILVSIFVCWLFVCCVYLYLLLLCFFVRCCFMLVVVVMLRLFWDHVSYLNVFDDEPNFLSPLFEDCSGSFELGFCEAISQIIHLMPHNRFLYSIFAYDVGPFP